MECVGEMDLNLLFFGATADATESRELSLHIEDGANVSAAVDILMSRFPNLKGHRLLVAVNQEYVSGEALLKDGDELAIFTPVSGG